MLYPQIFIEQNHLSISKYFVLHFKQDSKKFNWCNF